ncbi:MAG: NAD(P)-dependent oxidoreductase [Marmoricola sp.]
MTYPVGLRLANRRVVIVGAGRVTQRRIPALLAAGALIEVVAPAATPTVEGFARNGQITWTKRGFDPADLEGAWYAVAATDSPQVNASVVEAAEQPPDLLCALRRRSFLVGDNSSNWHSCRHHGGGHGQLGGGA